MSSNFISEEEFAQLLSIKKSTLRAYRSRDIISRIRYHRVRQPNVKLFFNQEDVNQFILNVWNKRSHKRGPKPI